MNPIEVVDKIAFGAMVQRDIKLVAEELLAYSQLIDALLHVLSCLVCIN